MRSLCFSFVGGGLLLGSTYCSRSERGDDCSCLSHDADTVFREITCVRTYRERNKQTGTALTVGELRKRTYGFHCIILATLFHVLDIFQDKVLRKMIANYSLVSQLHKPVGQDF